MSDYRPAYSRLISQREYIASEVRELAIYRVGDASVYTVCSDDISHSSFTPLHNIVAKGILEGFWED